MSLLRTLATPPWLPDPLPPPPVLVTTPAAMVGLRVLLMVIAALFALFALAFLVRAQLPDWQALTGGPGRPLASLAPLWVNTALLASSSVALQAASRAARRRREPAMRTALVLGGLFALAFLVGQGAVWQQLVAQGYFVASTPAASFFYLLTALHAAHLAGGLVAWGRSIARAWRGSVADERLRLGVKLCAHYWHFLLAVWLVIFALLASPQETLAMLAEICGIR